MALVISFHGQKLKKKIKTASVLIWLVQNQTTNQEDNPKLTKSV